MGHKPIAIVLLAAGSGTRMKSKKPKVIHEISGFSMLQHALDTAIALNPEKLVTVVKHERDLIESHVLNHNPEVLIADQGDVPGTGSAVEAGLAKLGNFEGTVIVTYGDVPLLTTELLEEIVAFHEAEKSSATVLTSVIDNPTGYGRLIREDDGSVSGIVEHKDATEDQLKVQEVNSGINVFDADALREALNDIGTDNSQGEKYLTDALAVIKEKGKHVAAFVGDDPWQTEGANDRAQLATLALELNKRILTEHMKAGVTIIDPNSTFIDKGVKIGQDVTIYPGTQILGKTVIGDDTKIGPDTTLRDMEIGEGVEIIRTHGSESKIEDGASVGPFSYIRPKTSLKAKGKIGTYVETKGSTIGEGSKVPHLSYIGDAEIGKNTNIGAGAITANYDGVNKNKTIVGNDVKTGSGSIFVAPVHIEDNTYTGAGAVIKKDVPEGSLAVSDFKQRNIEGWVESSSPVTKGKP
ncbi:MAG: bifunctional UDP-N-acetylglucosamine diphosphorylase/glucosamine-1-phosphate N-acetyltransferase GlmU [Micrococcaceae bacterium]